MELEGAGSTLAPTAVVEVDLLFPLCHERRYTACIEHHTDPVVAAAPLEEVGRNPVHNPLAVVVVACNLLVGGDDGSNHHNLWDRGTVAEF